MKDSLNLKKKLSSLNISNSDFVMLHVDSAVCAQYESGTNKEKVNFFCNELLEFFKPNGTIVVPTFTYSFTQKKIFNPKTTESKVGYFSEIFRKKNGVLRTTHPIFSVAVKGKFEKKILNCSIKDCFGDKTFFDFFHKKNGKIICIGCDLDRITFIHYLEQKIMVPYRYFKKFDGVIINKRKKEKINTRYFVRNLKSDLITDLSIFEKRKYNKFVKKVKLGRFYLKSISAKNLFRLGKNLINKDSLALVKKNDKI